MLEFEGPSLLKRPAASEDVCDELSPKSPCVGMHACVRLTGRIGEVVKRDLADATHSFKLAFKDGKQPNEDWFAADAVEVQPSVKEWAEQVRRIRLQIGSLARVTSGERTRFGEVLQHDESDASLSYKIKFKDGIEPAEDWCAADAVEVQLPLEKLQVRAGIMRSEAQARSQLLQTQIQADFDEYKTRLQTWAAGKAGASMAKILVGFVPGGHAVSEAATVASFSTEVKSLLVDCVQAAAFVADLVDLHKFTSAELASKEALLLSVLARSTRVTGETTVVGGHDHEPGHRVLEALIEIKELNRQIRTLDQLGFYGTISGTSKL